jgi:hypothetical protein
MLKLSEPLLKIVCLLLAALLLFQVVRLVIRNNPLERLKVPELPTLQADGKGTNAVLGQAAGKKGTNSVASQDSGKKGTNSVASSPRGVWGPDTPRGKDSGTKGTNFGQVSRKTDTNSVSGERSEKTGTNAVPAQVSEKKITKAVAGQEPRKTDTNAVLSQASGTKDTNSVAGKESGRKSTNAVAEQAGGKTGTNSGPRQLSGRGGPGFSPGQPPKPADLPPMIQARVDKITLSELLAPIMRPLPMALLGIAGKDAFLRAPSGQTGMVKEGDELGGMKLLRIGINRVLIEHEGEKKELTIFSGLGSESLLPNKKESTNEIITKPK